VVRHLNEIYRLWCETMKGYGVWAGFTAGPLLDDWVARQMPVERPEGVSPPREPAQVDELKPTASGDPEAAHLSDEEKIVRWELLVLHQGIYIFVCK
jgi:hypothetical protein